MVTWEEGTSTEEFLPSDCSVGMFVWHFIFDC